VIARGIWSMPSTSQAAAQVDAGLRHAPDDTRGLVLRDRMPATGAERQQALGTVLAHASQQQGHTRLRPVLGDAPEEHIHARPEERVGGSSRYSSVLPLASTR